MLFRSLLRLCGSILSLALISACSTAPIDVGNWQLRQPDGLVVPVAVSALRKNEYYFNAMQHPVSGVYALDKKTLRIIKPDNPRMGGYAWSLRNAQHMTLVEETPVNISGQRLISAELTKSQ